MTNSERIEANNRELQVCIDKANALPDAGGGGGVFYHAGQMNVSYTDSTLDMTAYPNYQNITVDNIYLVPVSFTISASGNITGGTYNISKTYSNGILTAKRDSIPGQVGLNFLMDVYVIE